MGGGHEPTGFFHWRKDCSVTKLLRYPELTRTSLRVTKGSPSSFDQDQQQESGCAVMEKLIFIDS
ncbi:MAG: hypothetical protein M9935_00185 [Kiritimatiellae bacterium]|nr:hypothetical protein [Kiritimatiellia bacterium]